MVKVCQVTFLQISLQHWLFSFLLIALYASLFFAPRPLLSLFLCISLSFCQNSHQYSVSLSFTLSCRSCHSLPLHLHHLSLYVSSRLSQVSERHGSPVHSRSGSIRSVASCDGGAAVLRAPGSAQSSPRRTLHPPSPAGAVQDGS